jgi:hypothetical protein
MGGGTCGEDSITCIDKVIMTLIFFTLNFNFGKGEGFVYEQNVLQTDQTKDWTETL